MGTDVWWSFSKSPEQVDWNSCGGGAERLNRSANESIAESNNAPPLLTSRGIWYFSFHETVKL